jgi:peptidoglycan/LPS O-acetylase OafA/YrhL
MNERIAWLDYFRGVAAIGIVLYHYRGPIGIRHFEFGFLAVDLFFVLSGIVLSLRYTNEISAGMTFRDFFMTRMRRLYPMAFIAGCVVLILNAANVPGNGLMGSSDQAPWTVFLPIPARSGGDSFPANSPVWSLWAELAANFVWFGALRLGKLPLRLLGALSVAALLVMTWQQRTLNSGWERTWTAHVFLVVRAFAGFSVGCCAALYRRDQKISVRFTGGVLLALLLACALGVPVTWYFSLVVVAVGALLMRALLDAAPPGSLNATAARWLATLSYPLYLIHGPAGRLLPCLGHWPTSLSIPILMGVAGMAATALNERAVRLFKRR